VTSWLKLLRVAGLVLMYWTAGFYPFDWSLPFATYENAAERNPEGGWRFLKPGIVKTTTPPKWLSEVIEHSSLKIVLEIRPVYQDQSGPARIITISQDPYHRNLTIAQQGAAFILRLRTPWTNSNGMPHLQIEDLFTASEWRRIEVLVGPDNVQIQVDGFSRLSVKMPDRPLSVWADSYALALGNEMTFDRPWLGEIRRAEITVGQKTFDYAREDLLTVPKKYFVSRRNSLAQGVPVSYSELIQSRLFDWLSNLIGFVPFGFLIAGLFAHRVIRNASLASFMLSLSMEAGQIFLPTRYPSSEDLLINLFGGALGAILAARIFRPSQ
jgi:hypothetical protein